MLTILDSPFYPGETVKARVLATYRFYALLDVRGWQMRLEKSLMSWGAIRHTEELFSVRDKVDVLIQTVDHSDPVSNIRSIPYECINCGYWITRLPIIDNPWPEIQAKYVEGSVIEVEFVDYVNWYIARVIFPEGLLVEVRTHDIHWTQRTGGRSFHKYGRGEIFNITIRNIQPSYNWVQICTGDSKDHHLAESGYRTPLQSSRHLTASEQKRIQRTR